jgi:hypothetical protein
MLFYQNAGTHTQWFWRSSQGYDLAIRSFVGPRGQRLLDRPPMARNTAEGLALSRSIDAMNSLLFDKRLPPAFFHTPTRSLYEPTDWIDVATTTTPYATAKIGGALVVASLPESAAKMLLDLVVATRTRRAIFRYPTQQWVLDDGTLVDLPQGAPKYEDPSTGAQLAPGMQVMIAGPAAGSMTHEPARVLAYDTARDCFIVELLSDPNGKTIMVDEHAIIY